VNTGGESSIIGVKRALRRVREEGRSQLEETLTTMCLTDSSALVWEMERQGQSLWLRSRTRSPTGSRASLRHSTTPPPNTPTISSRKRSSRLSLPSQTTLRLPLFSRPETPTSIIARPAPTSPSHRHRSAEVVEAGRRAWRVCTGVRPKGA
jgi:hypothetical protein